MIPRGEVGLIFAGIGASLSLQGQPILPQGALAGIVLMALVTTIRAPVGLRWAFRRRGTELAQRGERAGGGTPAAGENLWP
jgi:Kef-type K+ transport system membrane component KefB